jgi:SAM-dependent methyltransferase
VNPTPNFDRLARPYRWLEYFTFGPALQRCRTRFLPQLAGCRSALVLGDGDGRFTARLLATNPNIRVHAIDVSAAMLQALRESTGPHANRLTTEVADLRCWRPSAAISYDLVATHFFLDCLTTAEIAALASRMAPAMSPDAIWLISDFAIPDTFFGRALAAPLVATLYHAFRVLTNLRIDHLPDHREALQSSGWSLHLRHHSRKGLLVSQLWKWTALRSRH